MKFENLRRLILQYILSQIYLGGQWRTVGIRLSDRPPENRGQRSILVDFFHDIYFRQPIEGKNFTPAVIKKPMVIG